MMRIYSSSKFKIYQALLILVSVLVPFSIHSMEAIISTKQTASCTPDNRVTVLTTTVSNTTQRYKNDIEAIIACNAQKKFWDGTSCTDMTVPPPPTCTVTNNIFDNTTVEINQVYLVENTYTSPEVETHRCFDFVDRGRGRNFSQVVSIMSCVNQGTQVDVAGQVVTITHDNCVASPRRVEYGWVVAKFCSECFSLPPC